jgi:hypothetical protein
MMGRRSGLSGGWQQNICLWASSKPRLRRIQRAILQMLLGSACRRALPSYTLDVLQFEAVR